MFQINKKKLFILIIVWISMLSITFIGTKYYLNSSEIESTTLSNKNNIEEIDYEGKDYYSFFDENDLKVESVYINDNSRNYIKISGLKDKSVEEKINKELYDEVVNSDSSYIYSINEANFSNILSVQIQFITENETIYKGLNYNLNTGEKIKFNDLFNNKANVYNLVYKAFYNHLSLNYLTEIAELKNQDDKPKDQIDKEINNYNEKLYDVEETALIETKKYLNNDNYEFYINNYGISLMYNGEDILMSFKDDWKYYAIYSRYLTGDSIFEEENIGRKNIFVSTKLIGNYIYNKEIEDYGLIDLSFFGEDNLTSNQKKYIESKIESHISKMDKSKFTYLNIDGEYDDFYVSFRISKYQTSKEYYKNDFRKIIWDDKNKFRSDVSNFINSEFDENVEHIGLEQIVILCDKNDKIYDSVKSLFVDGFDYINYIKNIINMNNEEINVENLSDDNFELFNGIISIEIREGERFFQLSISDIPQEYLAFQK